MHIQRARRFLEVAQRSQSATSVLRIAALVLLMSIGSSPVGAEGGKIRVQARVLAPEPSAQPISGLEPYIESGLLFVQLPSPENGNLLQLEWIAN